ncbi:hypothetical protein ACHAW5_004199 [Stephanodiscus triporus]|uniref:CLASP N-terminal domain-containing protein n=1 Tax=Stephanodiscus triporus TaxID=2934178 RepID=A0ABD3PRP9_9STRA
MTVKLQPHPSLTMSTDGAEGGGGEGVNGRKHDVDQSINGSLETINGNAANAKKMIQRQAPPPPAFVGRLLFRDLLPFILDLSKQTVKTIRAYGVSMTIGMLPHCRVKSCVLVLLERMKTHQNRTVREDCARYLRCILETWPWDPTGNSSCDGKITNDGIEIVNSRKDERLSLDSTRQIGLGLGRTLSDSTSTVREEAKRGFEVLFRRFRPVWDEVMSSGVVRDVRLRKKLLEMAASHSDGNLFDDMASLGEMSLNSAVSGLSHVSHRSNVSHLSSTYSSRGMVNNGVPSIIGTPKVSSPRARSRMGYSPSSSPPSYMRDTGSSATRVIEQAKVHATEASDKYSINKYVTSTGHVLSTPSPRRKFSKPTNSYGEEDDIATAQQPFASLLQTPCRPRTPESRDHTPTEILRKRLSRRISGIKPDISEHVLSPVHQLSCINETEDCEEVAHTATKDAHTTEIAIVALEVVLAHLSHIEQIEQFIAKEKNLLLDLNKQVGISITDMAKASDIKGRLCVLTEDQVCDYFESVHSIVDKERHVCEVLLREMERISHGDVSTASAMESSVSDIPLSPYGQPDLALQRNLKDEFGAPT